MKQVFTILLGIVCLALQQSQAQSPGAIIRGKVTDSKNQSLAFASVSLLSSDSSLLKTALTNAEGNFEIQPLTAGNYFLKIEAVGYETFSSTALNFSGTSDLNLPALQLVASPVSLGAVVVRSKKPLVEVKADKTIFNVEASINATGSNALELLQKSPGVQVDNNDNVTMKGKSGVKIYVDGKLMQLDAKELAEYLKSINSNDVEAIEMISNPGAKYDASGNAGVINFRLKKNKKYGTNGNVNLGFVQGVTPKANGSLGLNYRNKKINLFGNLSGNIGNYRNTLGFYRIQQDSLYDQLSINTSKRQVMNLKAGADYFINSKSTIGFLTNTSVGSIDWTSSTKTSISYNPTNKFEKDLNSLNKVSGNRTNANFNLNYRYADTSGREYNVDVDYGMFDDSRKGYQPNNYVDQNGNPLYSVIYRNYTPTRISIFSVKADAEQKLGKGKFGYGFKTSFVTTENTFDFYNEVDGNPEMQLSRSNDFQYKENVNAAYLNYNTPLGKKWSMQAGVRAEQTNSEGDLTRKDGNSGADDFVKRHYLDLFPSAALTWNINDKNALNLTYSRRIDRPGYQSLNPFENKLDELTFEKGNAFLRPQYTDNVELTHTLLSMINTTIGFANVKDFSTQVTDTAGNTTFVQERNLASQKIFNASISSNLPIRKWWNGYINLWYNYQDLKGEYNGKTIRNGFGTYGGYIQQSFTLGKDYSAEASCWFHGPSYWAGTSRASSQAGVDVGVQKLLLDKKMTLKLSATDLFHTAPWRMTTDFGGLYMKGRGTWESQTYRATLSWRFGNSQVKNSRQRQTGLESENNRIK